MSLWCDMHARANSLSDESFVAGRINFAPVRVRALRKESNLVQFDHLRSQLIASTIRTPSNTSPTDDQEAAPDARRARPNITGRLQTLDRHRFAERHRNQDGALSVGDINSSSKVHHSAPRLMREEFPYPRDGMLAGCGHIWKILPLLVGAVDMRIVQIQVKVGHLTTMQSAPIGSIRASYRIE